MSNSLGEAVLDLSADSTKLDQTLKKTQKGTMDIATKIQGAFQAIVASAILQTIVQAYKAVIGAAEEAAVTEAKVAGVIRATGNAAGFTVGQLSEMATELSRMTGFDDEVVLNAEAVLLTFRQIGHEVFPEAMNAAIDMSAVLGQDLQSSVIQLGKALNDPIEGVTALKRVGVSFTEEQMNMIKSLVASNDVLGAQRVILDELAAEFGKTAEEMEKASTGGKRLKVSFGDLLEAIGGGMIPVLRENNLLLADWFDKLANNIDQQTEYRNALVESAKQLGYVNDVTANGQYNTIKHREEIERNAQAILKWTEYGKMWEERLAAEAIGVQELGDALSEVDMKSILDLTTSLSSETEKFNLQQDNVKKKQGEIQTEIDSLIASGWGPLSDKVVDLKQKYDDLGLEYDENALKHRDATNKIIYDLFLQKLSVDGLTQAEFDMALQFGVSTGQLTQEAATQAAAFDAITQAALEGRISVGEMTTAIAKMQDKNITITVNEIINSRTFGNDTGLGLYQGGRAKGTDGWEKVPSGFPDDTYMIGLTSGEHFSVVPDISKATMSAPAIAGSGGGMALASGGGGMPAMQFVYQPFIGVNDEYAAKAKLRSIVNDIAREQKK